MRLHDQLNNQIIFSIQPYILFYLVQVEHAVTALERVKVIFVHMVLTSVVFLTFPLFSLVLLSNWFQLDIIILMILTNLYHDGTTPRQLKALKRAKALEMKRHTDAMKAVTHKYAKAIQLAEAVRVQELEVGNNAFQGRYTPEQLVQVTATLERNRKKMTTVSNNLLKKSIDKV